jgi:hypothetical protein
MRDVEGAEARLTEHTKGIGRVATVLAALIENLI